MRQAAVAEITSNLNSCFQRRRIGALDPNPPLAPPGCKWRTHRAVAENDHQPRARLPFPSARLHEYRQQYSRLLPLGATPMLRTHP